MKKEPNVGKTYTRDEIHDRFKGSKQAYLPYSNGEIVAICLTEDANIEEPPVVLCGRGPIILKSGRQLATQKGKLPLFFKRSPGNWEFKGNVKVIRSHSTGTKFERLISIQKKRKKSSVALVVELSYV